MGRSGIYTLARVDYYISTASRPKCEKAIQEDVRNNLKAMAAQAGLGDAGPSVHIDDSVLEDTDAAGDFSNEERTDNFIDILDNFIPADGDAEWTGSLMPEGIKPTADADGWTGDASSFNPQPSKGNPS